MRRDSQRQNKDWSWGWSQDCGDVIDQGLTGRTWMEEGGGRGVEGGGGEWGKVKERCIVHWVWKHQNKLGDKDDKRMMMFTIERTKYM